MYLWKVTNSEKYVESYGQDIQRNTNVKYIVFVKVSWALGIKKLYFLGTDRASNPYLYLGSPKKAT